MTGIILTGVHPRRYLPGLYSTFGYQYALWPEEFSEFMNVKRSSKAFEDILGHAGMGLAVAKSEGNSIAYDDIKQGIAARFVPIVYGKGFIISHEAMADDLYTPGLVDIGAKFMAKSMKVTKEIICANILNNGAATTAFNSTGGDGQALFSSGHLLYKSASTYSNVPTNNSDLSELSLEQAAFDIGNLVDDAGIRMQCRPMKLIVSRFDEFNATRILQSTNQNDTGNNAINALRANSTVPGGYRLNHYLNSSSAWYLTTSENDNGLILMQREDMTADADNDFDTKNAKFSAVERYVAYWADARGVYGNTGS